MLRKRNMLIANATEEITPWTVNVYPQSKYWNAETGQHIYIYIYLYMTVLFRNELFSNNFQEHYYILDKCIFTLLPFDFIP